MQIILPAKIERRLKEETRKLELTEDELILKALSEFLKEPLDPESKIDVHSTLSEKYLKDAEELVKGEDYVQASEKAWGAASQIVKAAAAKKGVELRGHNELHKFVAKLRKENEDEEIRRLWQIAVSLHQNFYENWLAEETVRESVGDVKSFAEKLKRFID